MKKYDATLSNKDCVFNRAEGFESIADALEWASGRGGTYVIHLNDGTDGPGVSLSVTDNGSETTFSRYYPGGWVHVTAAEVEDMF